MPSGLPVQPPTHPSPSDESQDDDRDAVADSAAPQGASSNKFFLEIFACESFPLSETVSAAGSRVIAPILAQHAIGDDEQAPFTGTLFDKLCKLAALQVVAVVWFSPGTGRGCSFRAKQIGTQESEGNAQFGHFEADGAEVAEQDAVNFWDWTLTLAEIFWLHGTHVIIHPSSPALSWEAPVAQAWLQRIPVAMIKICHCNLVSPEIASNATWTLATTMTDMLQLARPCTHGGHWTDTAAEDEAILRPLCQALANILACRLDSAQGAVPPTIDQLLADFTHGPRQPSYATVNKLLVADGGGVASSADWTSPRKADMLETLRRCFLLKGMEWKILVEPSNTEEINWETLLSDEQIHYLRALTIKFIESQGKTATTAMAPDQPFYLDILEALCEIVSDEDSMLPSALRQGVSTGILEPLPSSGIWIPTSSGDAEAPLSSHEDSWQSARDHYALTTALVDKEVADGFVECLGPISQFSQQERAAFFCGKLSIAFSASRKPRLVLDTTVNGANPRAQLQERIFHPTLQSVQQCFPTVPDGEFLAGLIIDVSSAHKRIRLREEERNFASFVWDNKVYRYRTCSFGATYSSLWWARVGSLLLRLIHILLFGYHVALLYVDDFMFLFRRKWAWLQSFVVICFMQVLGVPLSWKKISLSTKPTWLGWNFDLVAMTINVTEDKIAKLQSLLHLCDKRRCERNDVEALVGLLMWITQAARTLRPWLYSFYADLAKRAPTPRFLTPELLTFWLSHCDAELRLRSRMGPFHVGAQLLRIGRRPVNTLEQARCELRAFRPGWVLIFDPRSRKVELSEPSIQMVKMFSVLLHARGWMLPLRLPRPSSIEMAADAAAEGTAVGLGAWLRDAAGIVHFAEFHFDMFTFPRRDWLHGSESKQMIACWETMAQILLIYMLQKLHICGTVPLAVRSLIDNMSSQGAGSKLFTTATPLAFFIQWLAFRLHQARVHLDLERVTSADNYFADAISRKDYSWKKHCEHPPNQILVTFPDLFGSFPSSQGAVGV